MGEEFAGKRDDEESGKSETRESSCGGWTVFDKSVDLQADTGIFVEKCENREIRKLVGEFSFSKLRYDPFCFVSLKFVQNEASKGYWELNIFLFLSLEGLSWISNSNIVETKFAIFIQLPSMIAFKSLQLYAISLYFLPATLVSHNFEIFPLTRRQNLDIFRYVVKIACTCQIWKFPSFIHERTSLQIIYLNLLQKFLFEFKYPPPVILTYIYIKEQ